MRNLRGTVFYMKTNVLQDFHICISAHLNFCLDFLIMQKNGLIEKDWFQQLWRHNLVNKQLQYTYCPISYEVKASRQWNLVS